MLDALVIGGGPAGLTAAIYLARFRRDVSVLDAGRSRARSIPVSRNTPGFPGGIDGRSLLSELREQAAHFGVEVEPACVERLQRDGDGFFVETEHGLLGARSIVLATGIEDLLPPIDGVEEAIERGIVRLCAVCDAYETDGRRVAVYGPPEKSASHARYLRSFSEQVTLVTNGEAVADSTRRHLARIGVDAIDAPCTLRSDGTEQVLVTTADGTRRSFDALYPVLGAHTRSQLAIEIGAKCARDGSLLVDAHQRTTVPGLYAAGDVTSGLNQISVAYGQAAIAATDIHNRLPHRPRRREPTEEPRDDRRLDPMHGTRHPTAEQPDGRPRG